ncbi:MAG: hypothetical protein ACF788_08500 [Novipirellula sp. JB048]
MTKLFANNWTTKKAAHINTRSAEPKKSRHFRSRLIEEKTLLMKRNMEISSNPQRNNGSDKKTAAIKKRQRWKNGSDAAGTPPHHGSSSVAPKEPQVVSSVTDSGDSGETNFTNHRRAHAELMLGPLRTAHILMIRSAKPNPLHGRPAFNQNSLLAC